MATQRGFNGRVTGGSVCVRSGSRLLATLCVAASAALVLPAGAAQAAPKPSLSEAKAQLEKLNSRFDHDDDKYNKVRSEWQAAKKKLTALNKSVAEQTKTYEHMRGRIAQMAASAYKNGDNGSLPAFVSAKDPQTVLDQMSVFTQLSKNRSAELTRFLNAAQLLKRQQAQAQQAAADLADKRKATLAQKRKLEKSIAKQQALIKRLGGTQSGGSSGGGSGGGTYNGPATGNARVVLKWAYSKLGTPYLYGGTGPRYDCSGFTMVAWQQGGVSLPRVVPDQYNATRRVARGDLREGDLVFFDNLGHVGIYVGGGRFIHSPHTGSSVKFDSMSNPWYSSHYVGAGRP